MKSKEKSNELFSEMKFLAHPETIIEGFDPANNEQDMRILLEVTGMRIQMQNLENSDDQNSDASENSDDEEERENFLLGQMRLHSPSVSPSHLANGEAIFASINP